MFCPVYFVLHVFGKYISSQLTINKIFNLVDYLVRLLHIFHKIPNVNFPPFLFLLSPFPIFI